MPWQNPRNPSSPYLDDPQRLGDVIAAIQAQAMATYRRYKLSHADWADRIGGDKTQAAKWCAIFKAHPEFFRLDSGRENASLVWRRQFPRHFSIDTNQVVSLADYEALKEDQKRRFSRNPLTSQDIKALIDTAVNLHSRAVEHRKEKRWWLALAGAAGGLMGSLMGSLLKLAA